MSPEPRYTVSVTHGDRIHGQDTRRGGGGGRKQQLGAAVHDRVLCYRVVAEFGSEDRIGGQSTLGCDGALAAANELAARLNTAPA